AEAPCVRDASYPFASGLRFGFSRRLEQRRHRHVPDYQLASDLRDYRGLPSTAGTPLVQDQSTVPVHSRSVRRPGGAEWAALVGWPPPASPPAFRPGRRRALPGPRLLLESHGMAVFAALRAGSA